MVASEMMFVQLRVALTMVIVRVVCTINNIMASVMMIWDGASSAHHVIVHVRLIRPAQVLPPVEMSAQPHPQTQ